MAHEKKIREAIVNKTLRINPWFITGFYDGDGGHSVILQRRSSLTIQYKCISYVYTSESSKIILEMVDYYFKNQYNVL
jgi:hypothetical protein